ncbi:type III secretion system export apparatus subunit SctR [Rhizobacter sp. Root1221]|uniref:type III secretion system export apparatus subunit SctR n=1 Tax=Rhizobacter sp. Root1221 TaxID=1736433 RepID=UPI0006F68BB9|nr:type III secretion system export apparatus subunit SctR [Rhizobacter sp. Root1221]KQW02548.1 type III secretion system protein SsaR [Rhizobacter sp. Root1221]
MGVNLHDPVTLVALIVAFGVAPFVALMMTSYTKLVIVFGLLRTALGLQQTPPNMVLNGLAIILSIYIMAPIGMEMGDALRGRKFGAQGESLGDVTAVLDAAKAPVKAFLQKHTHERDRRFFLKSAENIWPKERAATLQADDFMVLVPSFTLSELTRAFQIGFVIYLVFVVVDLIVATVLLALGMSMIAPTTISLPFKLLLFVILDGWSRLIHGLVLSYQ